jgi:hypothetical protein
VVAQTHSAIEGILYFLLFLLLFGLAHYIDMEESEMYVSETD